MEIIIVGIFLVAVLIYQCFGFMKEYHKRHGYKTKKELQQEKEDTESFVGFWDCVMKAAKERGASLKEIEIHEMFKSDAQKRISKGEKLKW